MDGRLSSLIGTVGVALLSSCAHGPVPLRWTENDPPRLAAGDRSSVLQEKVRVAFVDARPEPRSLFARRDSGREYRTDADVGQFCAKHFDETLARYGVVLVDKDETLLLNVTLLKAMVVEDNTYNGEMDLRVEARRARLPQPVWVGLVHGTSKRWGSSGKLDNYYETLTKAVLDSARSLLDDFGFVNALRSIVPPPALPPAQQP